MAFIRRDIEKAETALVVADAEGRNERQIAIRHQPAAFPVVFSRNGVGIQRPAWSMDGTHIALVGTGRQGGRHAVLVDVAQGSERVMVVEGGGVRSLAWLDARTLVLNRPIEDGALQLFRLSVPQGSLSRATFEDLTGFGGGLSVTSDGAWIVTADRAPNNALWIGDGRATEGKEYVAPALGLAGGLPGGFSLTWAGSTLIYPIAESLVAVESGSDSLQELIPKATGPESSADGRTIVYVKSGLWKADADGRHPVQLASGNIYSPVVTPDNQVIFGSTRDSEYSFWTVPLAGGTPPSLLVAGPASVPDLSPDGKQLMYGTIDAQHPQGVMVVCDLPRCTPYRYVAPLPPIPTTFLKWTRDGLGLAYVNQANIWIQPFNGGTAYQLTHFIDGRIGSFAWSRDGKRLALTRQLGVSSNVILLKSK